LHQKETAWRFDTLFFIIVRATTTAADAKENSLFEQAAMSAEMHSPEFALLTNPAAAR
jgi:hypothetical protein